MAAGLAGGIAGAAAGIIGHVGGVTARGAAIGLMALVGLLLAVDACGRAIRPLERDAETPKAWLEEGRLRWALRTGSMLGFGALTRVGFLSWYLLPLISIATQSWSAGAVIWACYGIVRTLASVILGVPRFERTDHGRIDVARLFAAKEPMRRWTSGIGVLIAVLATTAMLQAGL